MRFKEAEVISFEDLYREYKVALDEADQEIEENSITINYNLPAVPNSVFSEQEMDRSKMTVITEITGFTQDQITDLVGYYTGWMIYFEQQFTESRLRKGAAVHAKKNLEWALRCYFHDEKGVKTTQVDSNVKNTDAWKAADREEFKRNALSLKTEASMKAAKQMVFHLSRGQSGKADAMKMQELENSTAAPTRGSSRNYNYNRRGGRHSHDDFGL
jgi:hypothetical protein